MDRLRHEHQINFKIIVVYACIPIGSQSAGRKDPLILKQVIQGLDKLGIIVGGFVCKLIGEVNHVIAVVFTESRHFAFKNPNSVSCSPGLKLISSTPERVPMSVGSVLFGVLLLEFESEASEKSAAFPPKSLWLLIECLRISSRFFLNS